MKCPQSLLKSLMTDMKLEDAHASFIKVMTETMKILFVCTGNSFRSAVAEALLKKFRSDFVVESAGTEPASHIAKSAKELLKKENALGNLKSEPEGIEEKDVEGYDRIIVMKEGHKQVIIERWSRAKNKIQVWNIDDPIFLPLGSDKKIFAKIKGKVLEMAKTL